MNQNQKETNQETITWITLKTEKEKPDIIINTSIIFVEQLKEKIGEQKEFRDEEYDE